MPFRPTLTIPTPPKIVTARGTSAAGQYTPVRTLRMTDDEWRKIDKAAKLLELDKSVFLRWVGLQAANEVIGMFRD